MLTTIIINKKSHLSNLLFYDYTNNYNYTVNGSYNNNDLTLLLLIQHLILPFSKSWLKL